MNEEMNQVLSSNLSNSIETTFQLTKLNSILTCAYLDIAKNFKVDEIFTPRTGSIAKAAMLSSHLDR